MSLTISLTAGTPELDHNRRKFIAENVDGVRSKSNIVLKDMSLLEAYQEAFGAAIEAYNKTARKYLRLTPKKYLDKIIAGADKKNNPKPCLELILQVGDKDTAGFIAAPENAAKAKDILVDFSQQLIRQTQGHMIILGVYVHMDESTPHVHIDFIPLAHNYKKGLQVRNSLDKCLREMGYTSKNKKINATTAWQFDLRDQLVEICKKHGLEASWSKHDVAEEHLTVAQHKKLMRIAERKKQQALDNYQKSGLLDRVFGKADNYIRDGYAALEVIAAEQLESINKTREILKDRLASIQKRIDDLDRRSKDLDRREEKIRISEIQLNQSRQINDSLWNERNQDLERQRKELEQELLERKKQQDLELQRQKQQQEADLQQQRLLLLTRQRELDAEKEKVKSDKKKAANDLAQARDYYQAADNLKASLAAQNDDIAYKSRTLLAKSQELDKRAATLKPIEEANRMATRAILDAKAVQDASNRLKAELQSSKADVEHWQNEFKNAVAWKNHYKALYKESDAKVASLSAALNASGKDRDLQIANYNSLIEQAKKSASAEIAKMTAQKNAELEAAHNTIRNQQQLINALASGQVALSKVLDHYKLSDQDKTTQLAYNNLFTNTLRKTAVIYDKVQPSDDDMRDAQRKVSRSHGMSR